MEQSEIIELLTKMGALHGKESALDSVALMQDPIVVNRLAVELLQRLDPDTKPEVVLAPAGIESYFGYSCALAAWTRFSSVSFNDQQVPTLPDGVSLAKKQKVLLVFDQLDVEKAAAMVRLVKESGAKVSAVLALRNSIADAGAEFEVLKEAEIITLL